MTAHCKPTACVAAVLDAHQRAWAACNVYWNASQFAPDDVVDASLEIESQLRDAKPASMAEFFAKWRAIAAIESEIGDYGDGDMSPVTTQMLAELEQINGRWCEPCTPL